MDLQEGLYEFMKSAKENPRLGPSHISLYASILISYHEQECRSPLSIFSRDVMKLAKISSMATYRKCIRDLVEIGYIGYLPSYNPLLGSLVYLQLTRK